MTPASINPTTKVLRQGPISRVLPNGATLALSGSSRPPNTPKVSNTSDSGSTSSTVGQASGWAD
jgi:hypothetical protein